MAKKKKRRLKDGDYKIRIFRNCSFVSHSFYKILISIIAKVIS